MNLSMGDTFKTTGLGAASGAPLGPLGMAIGGTQGYFGGKGLRENEEAAEEAMARYNKALNEYQTGLGRTQGWEQEQYGRMAQQELQNQAGYMQNMQTGKQAAQTLQSGYAGALKQAQGAMTGAGQAPTQGVNSALSGMYQQEASGRAMNPLHAQAMEQGMSNVKQMAAIAAQNYGLDQAKLNAQLSQVANTAGLEKAVLAARFAAATGQYPLDMMEASTAGSKNAMISGVAGSLFSMGPGMAEGLSKSVANRGPQQRQGGNQQQSGGSGYDVSGPYARTYEGLS